MEILASLFWLQAGVFMGQVVIIFALIIIIQHLGRSAERATNLLLAAQELCQKIYEMRSGN
jgi:hypothetical protein